MTVPSEPLGPFRALIAALLLAFAAAAIPLPAAAGAPAPSPAARAAWGFARGDLAPHPEVRFGVLPSGMRYALMRSDRPSGGLAARLHVAGGAMLEGRREQGFMHLIEHMIFHGSANIPEGALAPVLARAGLARWSDFHAFTSPDETVYRLDLARSDEAARATALTLMREIASNLVFSRRSVAGARNRVIAEIAARDTVADRIATALDRLLVPDTRLARGPVAGTPASVRRAKPAALRRLYALHYTPARATLVLVGDFDPAAAEAELAARFADWAGPAPAAPPLRPPPIAPADETKVGVFVDPSAPTTVTIAALAPLDPRADAGSRRDSHFLERLGFEMLNRRLAGIAAGPDPPFAGATAAVYDHFSAVRLARVDVEARDRDWRRALARAAAELRRALEQGFSPAELAEQLAATRRSLARDAAPRTASALADAIVEAAGRGIVFTAPADAAATEAYVARVRLADVNAAFSAAWAPPARRLFVSHHRPIPTAEAEIAAGWASAIAAPQVPEPPALIGRGARADSRTGPDRELQ
ncbi:MAG TPA: insulinase family protein [Allosphingosinicella sp.]